MKVLKSFSGTGLREVTELTFTGGFTLGRWVFCYGEERMEISTSGFDCKGRKLVPGGDNCLFSETTNPLELRLVCLMV